MFAYLLYNIPLSFIRLHIKNSPTGLHQLIIWPYHTIGQILLGIGDQNGIVIYF